MQNPGGSKDDIFVSIIIPYVDELDYLTEAIASVAAQQLDSYEVIAVCNAPTHIILPELPSNPDPALILWIHEPQKGSAFARNAGLTHASGIWIQYLDVDDQLEKGKIKAQANFDEGAVVLSPNTYKYLDGKKKAGSWYPQDIWCGLLAGHLGSTSSWLWKKSAIEEAGGWSTDFDSSQEYELLFRIMKTGASIVTVPENLTIVRQRKEGSITLHTRKNPMTGIRLRESIYEFIRTHHLENPMRYGAFRNYIFKNLRALFIRDRDAAMNVYHKYYSKNPFMPYVPHIPFYGLWYKLLGFKKTEQLMAVYRKLRRKRG